MTTQQSSHSTGVRSTGVRSAGARSTGADQAPAGSIGAPAAAPLSRAPLSRAPLSRAALRRRLLDVGRPVLAPLIVSAVFRTLALIIGMALLAVAAWGVGAVLTDGTGTPGTPGTAPVGAIVAIMVALSLVKGVCRYLEQLAGHYVAFHALALLRIFFYDRLAPQAPAAVEGRRTGDLLSRVTKDVDRVEVFFAHTLAPATTAVVVPILTLGYLAVAVSPVVALVLAPFLLAVGVLVPWCGRATTARSSAALRATREDIAQHVTDTVQGVREVLSFNHEDARQRELADLDACSARSLVGIGRWIALRRGANTALVALALVAQLALVSSLVDAGTMTWQSAAVVLAITVGAFGPVLAVEDFAADLEQAYASARRIFEVTDAVPVVPEPDLPVPVPRSAPTVSIEDVTFTYPVGVDAAGAHPEPAVRGVSFTAAPGTTTALVGASGSGKSTLSSLLVRCWDADSGELRLDGVDVRAFGLDDLRATVAVAQQRPYLFNTTIEANLRMARPHATADEIAQACRRAALDEVVADLPDGLATVVGEMGERLSGGQRQRLAVARALLRDAPVLVLDEATSHLDAASEARVLAGVREAGAGRTVIVVAHRLATIADADHIVVLDAGRVVEQGTHDELLAAGGAYATLLDREAGSLDAD